MVSSGMLVLTRATWRNIPEDTILQNFPYSNHMYSNFDRDINVRHLTPDALNKLLIRQLLVHFVIKSLEVAIKVLFVH
jgi:hypothetical protein